MHKKEILHILTEKFKRLNALLQLVDAGFNKDDLYAFRQEIKKLKAFLRLVAAEPIDDTCLALQGKLKKLYAAAGRIRDIDLHIEKINQLFPDEKNKPLNYIRLLQQESKKEEKKFSKIYRRQPLFKPRNKTIAHCLKRLDQQHTNHFCVQNIADSIHVLPAKNVSDQQVHDIRKNIKNVLYTARLLKPAATKKAPTLYCDFTWLAAATSMAHDLGALNDISVSLLFLQPDYLDNLPPNEKASLQPLQKKWLREKTLMKKKILLELRDALPQWLGEK